MIFWKVPINDPAIAQKLYRGNGILPFDAHMAGGILAWKEAGFDTESG